jgi:hypothetical protein
LFPAGWSIKARSKQACGAASTDFMIPHVQWSMKNPSNFILRVGDKVEMNIQAKGRLQ